MKTQECTGTKVCTRCLVEKSFDLFLVQPAYRGRAERLSSECKKCNAERTRNRRAANPELARERDVLRRKANPELFKARSLENYAKHREKNVERARQRRLENYDAIKARRRELRALNVEVERKKSREYRAKNLEQVRKIDALSYQRNKENEKESSRTYYKNNKEQYFSYNALRRSRMRTACFFGDHKKISEIYRQARELTKLTGIQFHVDHVIPLNGKYVSGLHVSANLEIVTATENLQKHAKFCL
jgi:DNA mismatch repair ATPase MutS